jgi:hypothetical protein
MIVLVPDEIRALIMGDTDTASKSAGVVFPPGWPGANEAREGLPWHLKHLEADECHRAWRIRVVVERSTSVVVGSVNLKGPPDANGDVEIGWGVTPDRRRRGYALEGRHGRDRLGTLTARSEVVERNDTRRQCRLAASCGEVATRPHD